MIKTIRNIAAAGGLVVSNATVANATATKPGLTAPAGASLGDIIVNIVNFFLIFAGGIAILFLIIGGFRYVISAGNPDQVEGAKKTIMYAVIGLVIIFTAFVLVKVVLDQLGVTNINYKY